MKIKDTRESMLKVIREVGFGSKTYEQYVEELCDRLMEAGAFVPPVKCGEEVFAAFSPEFADVDEDDDDIKEPEIEPWEVRGYGVDPHGDIFLIDKYDEEYYVGTNYCKLTLEEAEEWLRKERENGRKDS